MNGTDKESDNDASNVVFNAATVREEPNSDNDTDAPSDDECERETDTTQPSRIKTEKSCN